MPLLTESSEGKPEECHQCKLIGATLTTQNIPVIHINENDEQVTQENVVERLTGGNCQCLGKDRFHSRSTTDVNCLNNFSCAIN